MSVLPIEVVEKLEAYEQLMLNKRAIENELEMLKDELLPVLPKDADISTKNGTFSIQSRMKWKYSTETQELMKSAKDAEKREQQTGIAEGIPGAPFLVFLENK